MDRREFLKAACAAGCLAAGVPRLAFSSDGRDRPVLVVLFLRGGADGLNLVGPAGDADYIAARPPELRVQLDGDRPGHRLSDTLDEGAGFAFHAEAKPLADLYAARRLAVAHAVGLADGTRSHFVAQDMMERGVGDEKRLALTEAGWLARALAGKGGMVPAYSATGSPVAALHGRGVLAAPDLANGLALPWGAPTTAFLRNVAAGSEGVAHRASLATLDVIQSVEQSLPRDGAGRVLPYQPAGKASYDGAGDLARSLSSVARLARMDAGLAVAGVDMGGWDTHENQPGRFANQVRQLALGLSAFHEDMAGARRPAVTVVMTEFGRRLRANKSNGTDHGHGACWLVLGDGVSGGRMVGRWPGLATARLDQGVDLAVTTDYRSVLAECLGVCDLARKDTFPAWKAETSLGLFAAA